MPDTLGGYKYRLSTVPGPNDSDTLTSPGTTTLDVPAGADDPGGSQIVGVSRSASGVPKASAAWWLVGLLAIVVLLHLVHREEKEGVDPNFGGVSAWEFFRIGLISSLFIITLKVGANKWFAGSTFAAVATSI